MDSCEEMSSIIYIDPVLYKAAEAGDIGRFENDQTCLDRLLTPDESTILHVYLRNQRREPKSTDFVDKILERCSPLLLQANKKGETPSIWQQNMAIPMWSKSSLTEQKLYLQIQRVE
ncbi:hypothetical protein OIU78_023115 [Salix suchowensis]|nr:hypothetical protein OIU78_023115 [Salix suchowensis]